MISTVVPLTFGGPRLFTPPPAGSSAEEVQALLPEARVVAAFHHIAAHELADTEHPIECDLLICGDDAAAKETVAELGRSMGLRPIDVGGAHQRRPARGHHRRPRHDQPPLQAEELRDQDHRPLKGRRASRGAPADQARETARPR